MLSVDSAAALAAHDAAAAAAAAAATAAAAAAAGGAPAGPDGDAGGGGVGLYVGWGLLGGARLERALASPTVFAAAVLSDLAALARDGDGAGDGAGGLLAHELLLRLGRCGPGRTRARAPPLSAGGGLRGGARSHALALRRPA